MAKVPDPDNVKTRLAAHLSDEERLKLYTKLLKDTIWKLRALPGIDTFTTSVVADLRFFRSARAIWEKGCMMR
jgi:2-phospho-L-lactate guanylyltransferase (CobY/MobA/RfbA family)